MLVYIKSQAYDKALNYKQLMEVVIMETEWTLYDLETDDEVKISGDLVHFRNSGLSLFVNDLKEIIKLRPELEAKPISLPFDGEPTEEYLDANDYSYWEAENGELNLVLDNNDDRLLIVIVTMSGNVVGSLSLSNDAIDELIPLLG